MKKILYIMGVSGSGKSTIGNKLSEALQLPFFDGDDFHPDANIQKMSAGSPLNETDRKPWLKLLNKLAIKELQNKGAVIACSALKESYREVLSNKIESEVKWIFLDGDIALILNRLKNRSSHFMPASLLQSQFDSLERPKSAITISIRNNPGTIIEEIIKKLKMKERREFGLIGLGVMGKNLSLNLAENGINLSLYNRQVEGVEEKVAEKFIQEQKLLENALGFEDLALFVSSLSQPRSILLMVKAGAALDELINEMIPYLSEGDVLIDGGNSHYKDTKRRIDFLKEKQIHFIGTGISGGEVGARNGPSIMPSGSVEAYKLVKPYLEVIAAKDSEGKTCCTYIGKDGAGHFVKMVHNGMEYAEMQLIAECYGLMRYGSGKTPDEIAQVYQSWMETGLSSYLLEITIKILKTKEGEDWLIDKILDKAGNKGTGSWTSIAAAELGIPSSMMTAALFARYTSSFKKNRIENEAIHKIHEPRSTHDMDHEILKKAYEFARLINHQQGFELIQAASTAYKWELNLSEIARIWTNGCIIRSSLMEDLVPVLKTSKNILNDADILPNVIKSLEALTEVLHLGLQSRQATPCFSAAINYWYASTNGQSTANIIQAQRDFFGAHRYHRTDDNSETTYHTNWSNL